MIFVLLSVLCSVTVAVILKYAKLRQVNLNQIIIWNYPVAVLLTYAVLNPDLSNLQNKVLPWNFYIPLAFLLPVLFVLIALTIKNAGLVKAEIAQRLSLFIPLIASFFLFSESVSANKAIGITFGLLAIFCSIGWQKHPQQTGFHKQAAMLYPILVFVGMGVIDILFKQIALYQQVAYMTSMFIVFILAMLVALFYLLYLLFVVKQSFSKQSLCYGIILGVFNFGNILFYMKAHRAIPDNPSVVFTGMNIGVISLGAVIGVLFFKESLSVMNKIGLGLSIISVLIISYL